MHALRYSAHVAIARGIAQQARAAPIRSFSSAADSIIAAAAAVAAAKRPAPAPAAQRLVTNDHRPVCSFCHKKGHTEAVCFAKHGPPKMAAEASAPAAIDQPSVTSASTASSTAASTAPAAAAAPIAAPAVVSPPVYKRSVPSRHQWASPESMKILAEKGLKRPRSKQPAQGTVATPSDAKIRALNRGAPPPRPMLPTPAAFRGVDKPWMQSELQLHFAAPQGTSAAGAKSRDFSLRIAQWTGLEEGPVSSWRPPPRQPDASWVSEPEWSPAELEQEEEIQARASAGSGTIVWDAALHLAHWLHAHPESLSGPVIELGSGTGVLGMAAEQILRSKGDASDATVVLTDEGKVLELLKQNVQTSHSNAVVSSLNWSAVPDFLSTLASTAGSSAALLPAYFSTMLCSELLDSIPSATAHSRAFDAASFATLVQAITSIARSSATTKKRLSVDGGVDVFFTFEQRGVLTLESGGMLDRMLLTPLKEAGFSIEQLHDEHIYTRGSALCLFKMHLA